MVSPWPTVTCAATDHTATDLTCLNRPSTCRVGYGDIAVATDGAKLFASLHIAVSVSWLAALIGEIDNLRKMRASQLSRAALVTRVLTEKEMLALERDSEQGVDKLEFVIGILMLLGVELCGQPLEWKDVLPFIAKFERRDVTKTGRITREDLRLFFEQHNKESEDVARELAERKKRTIRKIKASAAAAKTAKQWKRTSERNKARNTAAMPAAQPLPAVDPSLQA